MKNKIYSLLIIIAFVMVPGKQFAQYYGYNAGGYNVMLKSGDPAMLIDQKVVNIVFDYSNLKVGAFNSEAEFVDKKVKEYNEKKAGKGDKWKEGWINARKERYEPAFEKLFNKTMSKMGIEGKQGVGDAKYTLIVKTTFVEPGFNIGIARKPAFCNFEYNFVETADMAKPVMELYQNNVLGASGGGFDYDSGSRISESYAKGAKMLSKLLVKEMKKKKK